MKISSASIPELTPRTIPKQIGDNIRREPSVASSDKNEQKTSYWVEVVDLRKLDKNYQQLQKQVRIESIDFQYQKALKAYQNIYSQVNNRRHIDFYV